MNEAQSQAGLPASGCSTIRASATRKAGGWYPTLEYAHGGRVIGDIQCGTMSEAVKESEDMLRCMNDFPSAFQRNHPAPNQLIDLSNDKSSATRRTKTHEHE